MKFQNQNCFLKFCKRNIYSSARLIEEKNKYMNVKGDNE